MARFGAPKRLEATNAELPLQLDAASSAEPRDELAASVLRTAVVPLAEPGPDQLERLQRLTTSTSINHKNQKVAREAVTEAAKLRCAIEFTSSSSDRHWTAIVARFLTWAAVNDVVDARRALRRGVVEEFLHYESSRRPRGLRNVRRVLMAAGRKLYPQEYPPEHGLTAPRLKGQQAASHEEIRKLYRLVQELPTELGTRALAVIDLSYGAGVRRHEFKTLRGSAINTVNSTGHQVCVVTLPNSAGGVRTVPVIDADIGSRLLVLAAQVGDGLVLSPDRDVPGRNTVNRISEQMRRRGYAGLQPVALRNRWILDLAERVPAALLLQLADVLDLRVLADQRAQLPRYDARRTVTILEEIRR
jgi:hypothetical protein